MATLYTIPMSFLKALLPVLVVGILVALPVEAHAQSARFFGPIISQDCQCTGSAPEWGCVLDTVQAGFNLLFSLSMVFFVLMATYAGVLLMTSGPDASKRSKARAMLLNIVLGLLIALSAWLVVDFVMRALYDENRGWGPWNRILAVGAPRCLQSREPQDIGIEIGGGQVAGRFRVGDEVVCTFAGADHEATVTEIEQTNDDGSQLMTIRYDQSGATRNNTQSSACRSRSATEPGEEEPGEDVYPARSFATRGISSAQRAHASAPLNEFLQCMSTKVPSGVGVMTSISDDAIAVNGRTFAQCAANGHSMCSHSAGSCHYGGRGSCNGKSYAVDWGIEHETQLRAAARSCSTELYGDANKVYLLTESSPAHLHMSIGSAEGCGCN